MRITYAFEPVMLARGTESIDNWPARTQEYPPRR